jgi:asparagine synthetase B (glutamine-hydrolysing)
MRNERHDALLHLIRKAVRRASAEWDGRTGVPGVLLSGGLDSSIVAVVMSPSATFTGYYDMPGFDERHYARMVGGPEHYEIPITPEDFVENFDEMAEHVKPPIQGMGTFGQYMVAKFVSGETGIVLSGEGSDELFGGYARTLLAAGEPLPDGYENYQPPDDYPVDDLEAALAYDYERLPQLLAVDEQMCSAWGVESRAPFTDPELVEYVLTTLRPEERVGKRFLRETVRGMVPDAIIDRTDKMGFPAPYALWAQEEPVRSFILDRIGYLPNPETPWDRGWWYDMFKQREAAVA